MPDLRRVYLSPSRPNGWRAGELSAVRMPNALYESLRDLVRAPEDAVREQRNARHRLKTSLTKNKRCAPSHGLQDSRNFVGCSWRATSGRVPRGANAGKLETYDCFAIHSGTRAHTRMAAHPQADVHSDSMIPASRRSCRQNLAELRVGLRLARQSRMLAAATVNPSLTGGAMLHPDRECRARARCFKRS